MVATKRSAAWAGLVVFAGAMLLVIGMINVIEGIVALVDDERIVATTTGFVIVDLTSWGWVLLLFGLLMIAAGAGLLVGQTWARITAIVLVGIHAVVQVAWLGAYPVWSLLMIALDTVVLFALTARWSSAQAEFEPVEEPPAGERYAREAPAPEMPARAAVPGQRPVT